MSASAVLHATVAVRQVCAIVLCQPKCTLKVYFLEKIASCATAASALQAA